MATKYKTNKRKLSSLVKQQVPEFVLSEHPKFTEFLSSYFLFMESAELNLDTFTSIDNIILETETSNTNYLLLDGTNVFNLDDGGRVVSEQNATAGSFQKDEVITGSTSGATSTVLAEDVTTNSRLFVSANNAWITGETVTGGTSGATAEIRVVSTEPNDDGFADNINIETEADSIIDFSEQNPFGMP